jgi:hypothetical protein
LPVFIDSDVLKDITFPIVAISLDSVHINFCWSLRMSRIAVATTLGLLVLALGCSGDTASVSAALPPAGLTPKFTVDDPPEEIQVAMDVDMTIQTDGIDNTPSTPTLITYQLDLDVDTSGHGVITQTFLSNSEEDPADANARLLGTNLDMNAGSTTLYLGSGTVSADAAALPEIAGAAMPAQEEFASKPASSLNGETEAPSLARIAGDLDSKAAGQVRGGLVNWERPGAHIGSRTLIAENSDARVHCSRGPILWL